MLVKIVPIARVAKLGSLNCLSLGYYTNVQDTSKFSPRKFSKNRNKHQRKCQKQNEKFPSNQISFITKAVFRLSSTVPYGNWTKWTVLQRHLIPITLKCQWIYWKFTSSSFVNEFWMDLNFLSVDRLKTDEETYLYDDRKKKEWCRYFRKMENGKHSYYLNKVINGRFW